MSPIIFHMRLIASNKPVLVCFIIIDSLSSTGISRMNYRLRNSVIYSYVVVAVYMHNYITVIQVYLCDDLDTGRHLAIKEVQVDPNTPTKVFNIIYITVYLIGTNGIFKPY